MSAHFLPTHNSLLLLALDRAMSRTDYSHDYKSSRKANKSVNGFSQPSDIFLGEFIVFNRQYDAGNRIPGSAARFSIALVIKDVLYLVASCE